VVLSHSLSAVAGYLRLCGINSTPGFLMSKIKYEVLVNGRSRSTKRAYKTAGGAWLQYWLWDGKRGLVEPGNWRIKLRTSAGT
jgi:hypothetical protein